MHSGKTPRRDRVAIASMSMTCKVSSESTVPPQQSGDSTSSGMTNPKPRFNFKVPFRVLALAFFAALVSLVGWVWCGWGHVGENRLLLHSLPVPPHAERTGVGSHGYSTDDSMVTPPESWGTLAQFEFRDYTPEYLADFYISRLSPEWEFCTRGLVGGVWFLRGSSVVGLDTSNAPSGKGAGSFEIYVDHDYARNPCDK